MERGEGEMCGTEEVREEWSGVEETEKKETKGNK
jgi:hypothetical protein